MGSSFKQTLMLLFSGAALALSGAIFAAGDERIDQLHKQFKSKRRV